MLCFQIFLCVSVFCIGAVNTHQNQNQTQPPAFFVDHIFEKYGARNVMTYEGFEHLLENLGLGRLSFDRSHDISIHRINGSFYDIHDEQELHRHSHEDESTRHRRHVEHLPQKTVPGEDGPCLSPQAILQSYGLKASHGLIISHDRFMHICPAIIYELDQKHCWHKPQVRSHETRTAIQVWLEASISILIMSLAGLLCAAIVPILNSNRGGELLNFLVSVAAGTLAGDALIHLLPHALEYNPQVDPRSTPILRAAVALMSIIILYIIESILFITQKKKYKQVSGAHEEVTMVKDESHSHRRGDDGNGGTLTCMVIVGDILHNVTDGLSIGAAFSLSRGAGLACATAVFCHELPHELGDYAILIQEGMSIRRALLCNVFSSVFSFGGMALGLLLGEFFNAGLWINAFTAGSFIYIALANLVPALKEKATLENLWFQLLGLSLGIVLMIFIGLYEHDWEILLTQ